VKGHPDPFPERSRGATVYHVLLRQCRLALRLRSATGVCSAGWRFGFAQRPASATPYSLRSSTELTV